ncbi:MAG: monovalent cation/H+ antiporter subunit D family protein [Myxococcota bacterium]|nr:monovalent cation/H+ antiporter subunit D family protein [Myxococcota bacterium]
MKPELAISLAISLPLLGALGIFLTGRWPNVRETVTVVTSLAVFGVVSTLVPTVMSGARPGLTLLEVMPGLALAFEVEPLGMLYALVASGLWIPTALYSIGYCRGHGEENQTRFFICFALAIFAALGIAFARNLFTLFLFYEILTLSTYPLVTHYGDQEARSAGRTYLGILLTTSILFLLFAIVWTWQLTGTLEFSPGGILAGRVDGSVAAFLLALYAFGAGKAALMPFHRWLPAAMVAPTPVSALLHAVAIVKAGVFTVMKIVVYIFGIDFLSETGASIWLMYVASFTLIASSIVALSKDNLKARLAYSTISQLSYIVLGASLATSMGVFGGGMHLAMHAVGKITLFFCAGAIFVASHKKNVSELDGLGRTMPFTMAAFFFGSMSIIGLPPTGGAWSKWYLALGAVEGHHAIFVAVLLLSSLLSIAYLMPVVGRAFFLPPRAGPDTAGEPESSRGGARGGGFWSNLNEAPLLCVIPLCVTAIGCVELFFYAPEILELLQGMSLGR